MTESLATKTCKRPWFRLLSRMYRYHLIKAQACAFSSGNPFHSGFNVSSYAKESILGPLVEEGYLLASKGTRSVVYFANKAKVFPVY